MTISNNNDSVLNRGAYQLLPQKATVSINCSDNCFCTCVHRHDCRYQLFLNFQLTHCPPYHFSQNPIKTFFHIDKVKIELLSVNCKVLLHLSYNITSAQHLPATDMGRKLGGAMSFGGGWAGSPCNTMWPGPRPTCMPSFILIRPTVWQNTPMSQTGQTDRQRTDSIGRTVLQTVAQKVNTPIAIPYLLVHGQVALARYIASYRTSRY